MILAGDIKLIVVKLWCYDDKIQVTMSQKRRDVFLYTCPKCLFVFQLHFNSFYSITTIIKAKKNIYIYYLKYTHGTEWLPYSFDSWYCSLITILHHPRFPIFVQGTQCTFFFWVFLQCKTNRIFISSCNIKCVDDHRWLRISLKIKLTSHSAGKSLRHLWVCECSPLRHSYRLYA